jgi:manganese transport protein
MGDDTTSVAVAGKTTAPTGSNWRQDRGEPSLIDVFRSIRVRNSGGVFRRAMAFVGPGYLVSVGYMDPGNWATSIAGGAQFGYTLLFVALLSNIMAIILRRCFCWQSVRA